MNAIHAALALVVASLATAQSTIVIPNGRATTAGSTGNLFPWGRGSASPGIEVQFLYDSSHFTAQQINYPILIQRIRWRAMNGTTTWTGGTYSTATIEMSTAANDWSAISTTFASNHGPDRTVVLAGPVTVLPNPTPQPGLGPWFVDTPLSTPFRYDPGSSSDLCIDCYFPASSWGGGTTTFHDVDQSGTALASRAYASNNYPSPVAFGTTPSHGAIIELTYVPAAGYAATRRYGTGCYEIARSFYENFATAAGFDLANTSISMIFNGTDYVVLPGIGTWLAPSAAATTIANGDEAEQTVSLASPLPVIGGTVSALTVCSNGYVSTAAGNGVLLVPGPAAFLALPRTCWADWHNFNPVLGGAIKFEEVGNLSCVTWLNVADAGLSGTQSTFQFQFDRSTGHVHLLFQGMSILGAGHLVGFKQGGQALDPGNRDLSLVLPATLQAGGDVRALILDASARPVLGTASNLLTTNCAGAAIGANILSFTQHDPGLGLGGLGMPGCRQYVGLDVVRLFVPVAGTGTSSFNLPNNPAYAGMRAFSQSAAFISGFNPLGVIASNGLELRIDIN